jgi:hypothetical protein
MTTIRNRVINAQANKRGFSGVYDADEHRRMARSLTVTPVNSRYGYGRKLTDEQVLEIRQRYAGGNVRQHELAGEYGIAESTISAIVTWERYRDVEAADAR